MSSYKVLSKQTFTKGDFSIVPIRFEDRLDIMKWRNEQIYHLRQAKPLTEEDQNTYFQQVVSKLFDQEQPNQLLFSFLKKDTCIGYGGLVHINWVDKHAEISFVMNTLLEQDFFSKHWSIFLILIELVAFKELHFHKLSTYAFDLRPHLYEIIENAGFIKEGRLKEQCFFNGEYKDVLIHGKLNKN
ncbi:MAG: GNAT family N-acetyltransferase [Lishizhenia sp.]